MHNKSEAIDSYKSVVFNIISWFFGVVIMVIGLINTFWGNDQGFGLFLFLLSFVYFPPVNVIVRKQLGFAIPAIIKILLGIFLIWAALGVGELFGKIELMMKDLAGQ